MASAEATRSQGGAGAYRLLLPALTAACFVFGAGCRKTVAPPAAPRWVRLDALLTTHPAWEQVRGGDRRLALLSAPPAPVAPPGRPLPSPPALFAPPDALPASLVASRQERVALAVQQYLQQYDASLKRRVEERLRREERTASAQLARVFSRERAEEAGRIRADVELRAFALQQQITQLGYRDAVLDIQQKNTTGQASEDARRQLAQVRARLRALTNARADVLKTDVGSEVEARLGAKQRQRLDALTAQFAQKRAQSAQEVAALSAQERERIRIQPQAIPDLGSASLPPPDAHETGLTLAADLMPDARPAQNQWQAQLARQQTQWNTERADLLALIRADVQKAVAQIAQQQGWKLVAPGTRGAKDVTDAVAPLLRAQWR